MDYIEILDTTLRDGEQGEGISFTLKDKLEITNILDSLGLDIIEGGWPGSNPKSKHYFNDVRKLKLKKSQIAAFCSTHHPKFSAKKDTNLIQTLAANPDIFVIFGKTWDKHVRTALGIDLEKNLQLIQDSVDYLRSLNKRVIFDAEHFFDGYASNPSYSLKCLEAAVKGGADTLCLCDTNGGSMPHHIAQTVTAVIQKQSCKIGIHTHNDCGLATANTLSAIESGARHIQGTLNGYGERCGNANLSTIIPILKLKPLQKACSIELKCNLNKLRTSSLKLDEYANIKPNPAAPFVGKSAFAHKGGIHVSAILKDASLYEHIKPELIGNKQRVIVSEQSGASNILDAAKSINLDLKKDDSRLPEFLNLLKAQEALGYHYEYADGSLELLLLKHFKNFKPKLIMERFRVLNEIRAKSETIIEAIIKIKLNQKSYHVVAEGNGPVSAIDIALRSILMTQYPQIETAHLVDYKVRVLSNKQHSKEKVRVLISFSNSEEHWNSIGVSTNIINASFEALLDSYEYFLRKE